MKKVLLTLAAALSFGFFANAETVTLNIADLSVDDIEGESVEEVAATDTSSGSAQHWNVTALTWGGYSFTFDRGSYEYTSTDSETGEETTSTRQGTQSTVYSVLGTPEVPATIRIYNHNVVTITAPKGVEFTSIKAGNTVLYSGDATNSCTYEATATVKISTLTITTYDANDTSVTVLDDALTNKDSGNFTIVDKTLPEGLTYVWTYTSSYGAKASAYLNGTCYATESWLISKALDLTNVASPVLTFSHAVNKFGTIDDVATQAKVVVSTDGGSTWNNLEGVTFPTSLSWTFLDVTVDLSAYAGKTIQIAFAYTSSETSAGTWEVKNFLLTGQKSASVSNIVVDENAPVEYFNLQGVRVANPENGLYIRRQGNKATKVLVK
jgi:hypothetical protein